MVSAANDIEGMASVASGVPKPLQKLKQNHRCKLKEHIKKLDDSLSAKFFHSEYAK
jgi:hypothetical protein